MKQFLRNTDANLTSRKSGLFRSSVAEPLEPRICLTALFTPATSPPLPVDYGPYPAVVADFSGGTVPDVAAIDDRDTTLRVLFGTGNGGVTPAPGAPLDLGATGPLALGDFNGDGKPDVAFAYPTAPEDDGEVIAYLGNGDGTFTPAPNAVSTNGALPVAMAAGDFAGNGRSDLVVSNGESGIIQIMLSNPDGTFTAGESFSFPHSEAFDVVTGYFTGDGRVDVAVIFQNALVLLVGKGNGTFRKGPVSFFPEGPEWPGCGIGRRGGLQRRRAAGYLACADQGNNDAFVMLNEGGGRFTPGPAYPVNFAFGQGDVIAGDFTGNGREDMAVAANGEIIVLLGNGDGTFTGARAPHTPQGWLSPATSRATTRPTCSWETPTTR